MSNKDIKQLIKRGSAEGWTIEKTNGGHWKWMHPQAKTIFTSDTPSDRRAIKNIRAELDRLQRVLNPITH